MFGSPERSWQKREIFQALKATSELLCEAGVFMPVVIAGLCGFNDIDKVVQESSSNILIGASLALGDLTIIVQNMLNYVEITNQRLMDEENYPQNVT